LALAATASRRRAEIAAISDDRILAEMTQRIFYAGFSSKVVGDTLRRSRTASASSTRMPAPS
jgi:hypothetical protein